MFVIARQTAFTYRDKPVSAKQIGRDLNVRYVLEGSVRRLVNQVRVNAQLIDAETEAHLWAERFDDDTSDVFALQTQITSRDSDCARHRAGCRRGHSARLRSRCAGLYSSRTLRILQTAD